MSKNGVMGKERIMWETSEFKVEFSKCDIKEFVVFRAMQLFYAHGVYGK